MGSVRFTARMTRRRLLTLAPGVLLAGGSATHARALDRADIDAAAQDFLALTSAPGLAIGIVTPAGPRVFSYGLASRETGAPVEAGTLFEIGSISKTFTVALAAYAAETGALDWRESPGRFLPDLRGTALDGVTLRDLATHTTGGMPLQLPEGVKTNADLMTYYRAWTPAGSPGHVRTYANPSIGLLGLVAASALKGDFAALMRAHILAPLALDHTVYAVPPAERSRDAQGYTRDGRPARLSAAPLATEAYGLRTTAQDLLRFVEAQLGLVETDAVLRRALAATQVGHVRAGPMVQALIWEWYPLPLSREDFATGNGDAMVLEPNPVTRIEPPLAPPAASLVTKTGATNGFGAYAAFVPGRRTGLVVLANRNHPTALRLRLAERVFAALGVPILKRP